MVLEQILKTNQLELMLFIILASLTENCIAGSPQRIVMEQVDPTPTCQRHMACEFRRTDSKLHYTNLVNRKHKRITARFDSINLSPRRGLPCSEKSI